MSGSKNAKVFMIPMFFVISTSFLFGTISGCAGNATGSLNTTSPLKGIGWINSTSQQKKLGQIIQGLQSGSTPCNKLVAQFRGPNSDGQDIEVSVINGKVVVRKMKKGRTVRRFRENLLANECRTLSMLIFRGKLWKAPFHKIKKTAKGLSIGSSETGRLKIPKTSQRIWRQQAIKGIRQQLLGMSKRVMAGHQ